MFCEITKTLLEFNFYTMFQKSYGISKTNYIYITFLSESSNTKK